MGPERAGIREDAPPPFVRVAPSLFLGSARAAGATELLARAGVTLCVNVSRQQPGPRAPGVAELRVPVFDDPAEDLLAHLEPTCAAMEAAVRAGGACLVYCKNGRSRSAAVCTAYLMRYRGLSLAQAFQSVALRSFRALFGPESDLPKCLSTGVFLVFGGCFMFFPNLPLCAVSVVTLPSEYQQSLNCLHCLHFTVKHARSVAEPNPGFWSQLQKYEDVLQSQSCLPRDPLWTVASKECSAARGDGT